MPYYNHSVNFLAESRQRIRSWKTKMYLEYACEVWHSGLTKEQSDTLERLQKRELGIVYPDFNYQEALSAANVQIYSTHKLHHLLPKE